MLGKVLNNRYRLDARLGKGGWSSVYQATDLQDNSAVVVKLHDSSLQSALVDMAVLYNREAITLVDLHHDNIVRVLDFGLDAKNFYLVMEDDRGISLHQYLRRNYWPSIEDAINIIQQVTTALHYIHSAGIIHQDLKPSNIILRDGKIDRCKLADFGCAVIKRQLYCMTTRMILGTFPYVSPEQQGAFKGAVDVRSDLFALGVMFYELLCAKSPFGPSVHAPDIKTGNYFPIPAPSSINPLVPAVLDKVVLKLLQYDPQARYQTAQSLLSDLAQYTRISKRIVGMPFFRIGQKDEIRRMTASLPIIGRDPEINALLAKVRQTKYDEGSLVFISGDIGSGKSRLVEALRELIKQFGYILFLGKSTDREVCVPNLPLVQIFQDYAEYLATLDSAVLKQHMAIIDKYFYGFSEELSRVAPSLARFVKKTPQYFGEDPRVRQNQYIENIAALFRAIGSIDSPVVLVFEDIQWADSETFQLLSRLTRELANRSRLMVIATYRSGEVAGNREFNSLLELIGKEKQASNTIALTALAPQQVSQMISYIVPAATDGSSDLVKMFIDICRGNPLFMLEMLRDLIENDVVSVSDGRWKIRKDHLDHIGVGMTLAEVIFSRIEHLTRSCKELLNLASCIGRNFSRQLLRSIVESSNEEFEEALSEALDSQMVVRVRALDDEEYSFTHDRVHEVFYQGIDAQNRSILHLHIARTLESLARADIDRYAYQLAYHYARGNEPYKAFDYSMQASEVAFKTLAMQQAAQFLAVALDNAVKLPIINNVQLVIEAREKLGDALSIIGEYDRAIEQYSQVKINVIDKTRLAIIERKLGGVQFRKGQLQAAIGHFSAALKHLDGSIAKTSLGAAVNSTFYFIGYIASTLIPKSLLQLYIGNRRERIVELVNLYHLITFTLFWVNLYRSFESHSKVLFLATLVGSKRELCQAFDFTGMACARLGLYPIGRMFFNTSRKLAQRTQDRMAEGNNLFFNGLMLQWRGLNTQANELFAASVEIFERVGSSFELELSHTAMGQSYRNLGNFDSSCASILKAKEIAESVKDYRGIADAYYELAEFFLFNGEYKEARQNIDICFKYTDEQSNPLLFCIGERVQGKVFLGEGEVERAIQFFEHSIETSRGRWFVNEYTIETYLSLANAYLTLVETNQQIDEQRSSELLRAAARLSRLCLRQSRVFRNYRGPALRLKAQLLFNAGKHKQALECFNAAIEVLRQNEQRYQIAITKLRMAHYLKKHDAKATDRLKQEAAQMFKECNVKILLDTPLPEEQTSEPRGGIINDQPTSRI